jgi:hypothetical protein
VNVLKAYSWSTKNSRCLHPVVKGACCKNLIFHKRKFDAGTFEELKVSESWRVKDTVEARVNPASSFTWKIHRFDIGGAS